MFVARLGSLCALKGYSISIDRTPGLNPILKTVVACRTVGKNCVENANAASKPYVIECYFVANVWTICSYIN